MSQRRKQDVTERPHVPTRTVSNLSIAAAASAWAVILGHLTDEEAAAMIVALGALAFGGTGWHVGYYFKITQSDPEFLGVLRSSRRWQIGVAALIVLTAAVATVTGGAEVGKPVLIFGGLGLVPFVGSKPLPEEVERRRVTARHFAVQAGAVAMVALLLASFLSRLQVDSQAAGVLSLSVLAVGFIGGASWALIRDISPGKQSQV